MQITGASGELQFSHVNYQPVAFLSATNYVFTGNSVDALPPPGFWNNTSKTSYYRDTITGGDTASSGSTSFPNPSSGDGSYLLATVQVYANPNLVSAGDSFQIGLVPSGGTGDPNTTYFLDGNGNQVSYTSTPVTVDVVSAGAAVPEPGSLALGGLTAVGFAVGAWLRRRRANPSTPPG